MKLNKDMHTAYIAVGANLGDRIGGCRQGVMRLGQTAEAEIVAHSSYYCTEPVDYTDQPWFVNAVCCIRTRLTPAALLACMKTVEAAGGRKAGGPRFGPRMLDLDLIFYDQAVIETAELIVPHPRVHQRVFVLRPMHDIAPDFVHPVLGATVRDLLGAPEIAGQACFRIENETFFRQPPQDPRAAGKPQK